MTSRARPLLVLLLIASACATPAGSASPDTSPMGTPAMTDVASPEATASPSPASTPSAEPAALSWEALDAGDGPAAREDHTWTVIGDGRTALLFGGRDGATTFGDLWAFDLADNAWRQVAAEGGPPARFGHEATWVDGVGLVVFAGQAGATFFNDLWAFDPESERWTKLPAGGDLPVARYGTCAALGPDGRLWISHGFTAEQVRFADTKAYDFAAGTWTDESPAAGARPVERCLHGCWWTDDGQLALYAGQTTGTLALGDRWTLTDGAWAEIDGSLPPERNLYARARVGSGTLVFGGQALDGSYLADLWLLRDGVADAMPLQAGGGAPPARRGAELVHDPATGRALLFGGLDAGGALSDVWALDGVLPGS